METEDERMNAGELSQAVSLLLERESSREKQQRRSARKQRSRRRREMEASISRLAQSVEVIKWCIVGITTAMVLSFVILIFVVVRVKGELEKVNGEVQRIQRQVEAIREKIHNPLETLGATLGGRLQDKLGDRLSGEDEANE